MPNTNPLDNLGPLPIRDRNSKVQDLSFRAFRASLPEDRFVFRDERADDAGVDGSVELLVNGQSTNFRAQVQLKGTDSTAENADGSVSVPVKTSNLNYLLNGQSPFYVLYVTARNELRFAWARDERQRIEAANADWQEQETIALRFERMLTSESLDDIYDRIAQEAGFQRSIHDVIARSLPDNRVVVSITPETLQHSDPRELEVLLEEGGIALVSAGYAREVTSYIGLIGDEASARPTIRLLNAYAEYSLGRYDAALSAARDALLQRDELSEDDRQFLDLLRNGIDLQAGRITADEYLRRQDAWQNELSGVYRLSQRLDYLRHAIIETEDSTTRVQLAVELRAVVEQILSEPQVSNSSRIQAQLGLLYIEGQQFLFDCMHEISAIHMRSHTPQLIDASTELRVLGELARRWANCMKEFDEVLSVAVAQTHPLLVAEALVYRSIIISVYIADLRIMSVGSGIPMLEPPEALDVALTGARQAADIYQRAGHIEGEIRALVSLADLLYLAGKKEEARQVAASAHPRAVVMGYAGLARQAVGHLEGRPMLEETLERTRRATAEDNDAVVATHDDRDMCDAAKVSLTALGLSENRLPNLEHEMLALRDMAKARLEWCRYIEMVQDLKHTQNRATYYQQDPDRYCRCRMHGYESLVGNPDWKVILAAFKQTRCDMCQDRSPKSS